MKMDLGIQARWLLSMSPSDTAHTPIKENVFIGIHNGKIQVIEKLKASHKKSVRKFIDAKDHLLMPGFVNGHAHLPMSLFRGVEDDANLETWLFKRILPLEAKFVDRRFVKLGIQLAALESTRFGVTTSLDMYFYPEECAKVWDSAGLRGIFCQAFTDFPIPEDKELGPDRWARFLKYKSKFQGHTRISFALGPHAPYTCSDELLRKTAEESKKQKVPLHIHLCETASEVQDSLTKFGKTPTERLRDLGVLGPNTICAHGIHFSEKDIDILAENQVSIIHNPDSNTKLASGICPIDKILTHKIRLGFGTDGVASNNNLNMFGVMNLAAKLQKVSTQRPDFFSNLEVLHAATLGGAEAIGLGKQVGSIEIGKDADLLLVNLNEPHLQPLNNIPSHLIYACTGLEVESVFCQGELLYHKGQYKKLDAKKILSQANRFKAKILSEVRRLRNS